MAQSIDQSSDSGTAGIHTYLIAAGVVIAAIVLQTLPHALEALQWHREATFPTRFFDWITGHLTHWSWDHLFWDVSAFLTLSFVVIRLKPERFLMCLGLAVLVIPLEIALNQPLINTYRGLSGIDAALFGLIVYALWQCTPESKYRFPWNRLLAVIAGAAFVAKFAYEIITGGTLFVENPEGSQSFVPVASAHLTGAAAGLISGLIPIRPQRKFHYRHSTQKT